MNIIGALDVPTEGEYFLGGEDVADMSDNELAEIRNRMIGFIFQQYNLLPKLNLLENVELPLLYAGYDKKEQRERAMNSLKKVGLDEKWKNLPNQLSGGQQQRVSIARALAGDPSLILADEPTGNLDVKNSALVFDLLTRLDLGKRGALYLDHMKSSADHLLELVTDLLDFYKLDSNKVAVNRIAFSPADLFTAVCTGFEPVAAAKGIELRCTLAAELSGQVAGDPSRVRQIAENLLSNAIKFTDRGFVAFDAWLEEGRLLFRVSDTGRGIGPEERERIFQEFVRLPSAGGVSGVGLGLSIVDRLVKLLGGTIELESEPGAGSRFLVAVPVGEAEDDASEKEAAAGMCSGRVCMEGGRPLRCLLVDDDPLQLEMTAVLCRELGIETESCPFPEYAEKLVQESAFDLVFTDIQMPGVDGFEVLRRIRAVRAELPVVAVSARSDDESAYVERGFAAVLRKPFARAELVAVLRRVVPEAGVAPEECLPEEDAVRGFEALTAFARDDAEAAREIIRTFVAENEAHAETLRRAALAGDAVALRAIAHKMVPIYTLLGEEELAAALRRLERSEGSADGALRSAALGVAERVGEIVRAAKKEYLCDR
jgi:ABC-type lipoprotein export system ATPase subunit/CheY-like chemotaxis protein/anti-sigma regulatory factor (Ser/Thr protein kinase)/HPt (histidine-containing phosphotransfer) domain-containing protein